MKSLRFAAIALLAACASAKTTTEAPAPAPAPPPATTPANTAAGSQPAATSTAPKAFTALAEAPRDWQLLDVSDRVAGISERRAERELLAGKQPKRTVLVAVIDGGIDTAHVSLKANLWSNPKEVAGNGKDDDNNGYVDDVRGWNFIGGKDGKDVQYDLLEVTRLYVRCSKTPNAGPTAKLPVPDAATCKRATDEYQKQRQQNQNMQQQVGQIATVMTRANEVLHRAMGPESLTKAKVTFAWSASSDAGGVTGYRIYRNNVLVATTTSLTWTDTRQRTQSTYYAVAYDAAGNVSAHSASVTVAAK